MTGGPGRKRELRQDLRVCSPNAGTAPMRGPLLRLCAAQGGFPLEMRR